MYPILGPTDINQHLNMHDKIGSQIESRFLEFLYRLHTVHTEHCTRVEIIPSEIDTKFSK